MYVRELKVPLGKWLNRKEVIILYGARQVGKTTLLHQLFDRNTEAVIFNCELPVVSDVLQSKEIARIKALFENKKIIALDEAQTIVNIGSVLKLIYDELPQYKIIATGSSSFDLANKIVEPLTGRNVKFRLFPLSITELKEKNGWLWVLNYLNSLLVYGSYPGIIDFDDADKKTKLSELTADYLFRDILVYERVKNPLIIRKLLKAIALQLGSQVSTNELSNLLGISRQLVEKYIDLLEKSFVIFSLPSYSTNLRNEIKKSKKYYFYDLGIRNALIGDFTPVENRSDKGALWENFCISERLKILAINKPNASIYFWRTYDGAEIDLVEENDKNLEVFEFKWKIKRKPGLPESFARKYNVGSLKVISPNNLHELIN